ncbi:hypothetical protein [Polycladomyces subterraneus]|uniref:DoxX family membrane protein n=1 Tax=Polycladomyces subterraneus TaxID=1016997 RepID=A0ABT8ISX3_9BACL|nr:hypothetical protein [Polycladomyces subterraneus]MDN4595139.1 hypothetical protein [Polycladomyces subterraneus]
MIMVTISRWLLGLIFLSAALNGWAVILGLGAFLPTSSAAEAFLGNGYLLVLVKGTELVAALLLVNNRFVPLALVVLAPLVVNIFCFHWFVDPGMLPLAVFLLLLWGHLVWSYRRYFLPLVTERAALPAQKRSSESKSSMGQD